mmetsp:Transcript_52695/g.94986  ORF Transcript_52695/g.94986 Transcript_52695/m.94986 type:complete len:157 (+) Transcript_52695:3-473(+)
MEEWLKRVICKPQDTPAARLTDIGHLAAMNFAVVCGFALVMSFTLKGCEMEEDSYSCQAKEFKCTGLAEFCDEKKRQCNEMKWSCKGGKLNCEAENQDICAQLNVDCKTEKDSSLGQEKKAKASSFIQATMDDRNEDLSPRAVIHRHRKKLTMVAA